MKTNYLLRNKSRRTAKSYRPALIVVLIFVISAGAFSFLGGSLSYILSPMWQGREVLTRGVVGTFSLFEPKNSLIRENTALRERVSSYEAELASLGSIEERETALLALLGRVKSEDAILASVLVRPPETPYDMLVVDAGSNHGVEVGQRVSMPEGSLLGIVEEVFARTSKVKMYSSDGERTNAVLERHNVPVILLGQGGGGFKLTLPRDVAIEEGDRILEAGVFSELVAVVGKVNMTPTDSFKEVLARSVAGIFTIRHVLIQP